MGALDKQRAALAAEGIVPELFATQPDNRMALRPETRDAVRMLARRSARAGTLSPLGYNLTISHRHRFVWFRVAKVATRTILSYFAENGVTTEVEHAMKLRYPAALFADYFTFSFVRDPLSRFVSAWRNKVEQHNHFGFDEDTWHRMRTIEHFAHWVSGHDLADITSTDIHLALQSRLVDLTAVDYLGRLEHFDADFAEVCSRIGAPVGRAQTRNRTSRGDAGPGPVSAELRDVVAELYRKDYQVFGY